VEEYTDENGGKVDRWLHIVIEMEKDSKKPSQFYGVKEVFGEGVWEVCRFI